MPAESIDMTTVQIRRAGVVVGVVAVLTLIGALVPKTPRPQAVQKPSEPKDPYEWYERHKRPYRDGTVIYHWCAVCKAPLKSSTAQAGEMTGRCPKCGAQVLVPLPEN